MKERLLEKKFTRREIVKGGAQAAALFLLAGCLPRKGQPEKVFPTGPRRSFAPEREFVLGRLGPQEVVFPEGLPGYSHYPDGNFSLLHGTAENYYFMAAGRSGVMLTGRNLEETGRVETVISPAGGDSFDAHYAAPGSVNLIGEKILMTYHGEYHYNSSGEYHAGIGLAQYNPISKSFERHGQIIDSSYSRPEVHSAFATGVGQPSVLLDKEGKNLLCYYVEWPELGQATIALSRVPVEQATNRSAWRKFYQGEFSQPGLGGNYTSVMEMPGTWAGMPQVTFNEHLGRYLAVFNSRDAFYTTISADGLNWERPKSLLSMAGVTQLPEIGKPFIMYPSLVSQGMDTGRTGKEMDLIYAYTPHHPSQSHFMVRRRIILS